MSIATRSAVIVLLSAAALPGCSKPLDPPPAPPPTITQATFEPVYRASKAIQGATGPGVTYAKFGELLQGLSTEIAIAKDRQRNDLDNRLLALYEEALTAYKFSAALWKLKIDAHDDLWKGEIPVGFYKKGAFVMAAETPSSELAKYGLTPVARKVPYTGAKYQALPAEAIQIVWAKADGTLKEATDLYYGRQQQKTTAATTPTK
jgi:hypothetical protein